MALQMHKDASAQSSPASPTPRTAAAEAAGGVGSGADKTEVVRIQELSLQHSASSRSLSSGGDGSPKSKHPLRADGRIPDGRHVHFEPQAALSRDRKRSNKRAVLSPSVTQRAAWGEMIKAEGELIVAEQIVRRPVEQQSGPAVFRTLGSIHCVLVLKPAGLFLQTVATDSHHKIVLELDCMELVHEAFQRERKFQLRYRRDAMASGGGGSLRSPSYAFLAPTADEYRIWTRTILEYQAQQGTGDCHSVFSSGQAGEKGSVGGSGLAGASSRTASASSSGTDNSRSSDQFDGALQSQTQPSPAMGNFVYSTPPKTKHFILVRHGHYINAHVPQVADSEQVLSQMGRQQAGLTGKYLELLHNRAPSRHDVAIYHSDMTRAVETAAIISADLGECSLNPSPLLREGWPGQPYAQDYTIPHLTAAVNARNSSAADVAVQERNRMDAERMEKAFRTFVAASPDDGDEESYRVIVCHANLIRFFLCRALGVDPVGTWGHLEINHCGVTRIDIRADRPLKVVAVNETGHLPHSLITSSEDHL